jgi:hypothetical protein
LSLKSRSRSPIQASGTLIQLFSSFVIDERLPTASILALETETGFFLGRPLFLTVMIAEVVYIVDAFTYLDSAFT